MGSYENKDKSKAEKKQRGEYNDKLTVKGSFLDIVKASVKDANAKTSKKKKKPEE